MPLKLVVDSLDDLHESLRDLYKEKDGKFHLQAPDGFVAKDDVEDTSGLKSALDKEREGRRAAEKKAKSTAEKFGAIDVDKYNAMLDAEASAEEQKSLKAGEFEKIKDQMKSAHGDEVTSLKSEITRLEGQLNTVMRESRVVEAISKANGNVELLKPHVLNRTKLNTDDFSLVVTESDGTPKVDGDGNPVNLESLVDEMSNNETFKSAFAGTTKSGSGSEPQKGGEGNSNANGGKPIQKEGLRRSEMSDRQKIDYQKEYGLDALMELPN